MKIWMPGDGDFDVVSTSPLMAIGSYPGDYNYGYMDDYDYAVNLSGVKCPGEKRVFRYNLSDIDSPEHVPSQREMETFLSHVHEESKGGSIYWHCQAGINRSALFLSNYLHLYQNLSIEEAIRKVRVSRPQVFSNKSFVQVLRSRYLDVPSTTR